MCSETPEDMLYLEGILEQKKISVLIKNVFVYPGALGARVCTQCAKGSCFETTTFR
jgi:hypothetical protein